MKWPVGIFAFAFIVWAALGTYLESKDKKYYTEGIKSIDGVTEKAAEDWYDAGTFDSLVTASNEAKCRKEQF